MTCAGAFKHLVYTVASCFPASIGSSDAWSGAFWHTTLMLLMCQLVILALNGHASLRGNTVNGQSDSIWSEAEITHPKSKPSRIAKQCSCHTERCIVLCVAMQLASGLLSKIDSTAR